MEAANQVCGMAAQEMSGLTYSIIQEMPLRCTTGFNGPSRGNADLCQGSGVGGMEADEDFVCGVLQASARLVEHPGSFAGKLAELVTIGHVRQCTKY
jgi:hypothetical protein